MEPRLEKIEAKLTLTEDLLEEVNKTIYRQQCRIDQLQQELSALRQQVQAMPVEHQGSHDEVPPHY